MASFASLTHRLCGLAHVEKENALRVSLKDIRRVGETFPSNISHQCALRLPPQKSELEMKAERTLARYWAATLTAQQSLVLGKRRHGTTHWT